MDVRPNTSSSTHDDDGFESLNGNGSSDNPEEDILTGSTITSQTSESTSAEQSSSTPKHDQLVEKVECDVTLVAKKANDPVSKNVSSQKRCLRFKKTPLTSKASIADLDRRLSGIKNLKTIILIAILLMNTIIIYFFSFPDILMFSICS